MSVRPMFVRILNVSQYTFNDPRLTSKFGLDPDFASESEIELEDPRDLEWFLFDGKFYHSHTKYQFVEIGTCNWPSGARMRVKRLPLFRALAYVNKLQAGQWISDDVYHALYTAIDRLLVQSSESS